MISELKIKIHDQLRDLGRELAAEDSKWPRLIWRVTHNIDILLQQSVVSSVIQFSLNNFNKNMCSHFKSFSLLFKIEQGVLEPYGDSGCFVVNTNPKVNMCEDPLDEE